MIYAVSDSMKEIAGSADSGLSSDEVEGYKKEGWTVEKYSKDGYTGYTVSKENIPFAESLVPNSETLLKKEGDNTYSIDLEVVPADSAAILKSAGASAIVRITFPSKPLEQNATKTPESGYTYEWDLLSMNEHVKAKFEIKKAGAFFSSPVFYIIIALVVIAIVVLLLLKRKKKAADASSMVSEEVTIPPEEYSIKYAQEETSPESEDQNLDS